VRLIHCAAFSARLPARPSITTRRGRRVASTVSVGWHGSADPPPALVDVRPAGTGLRIAVPAVRRGCLYAAAA
jgi:hypothetical protein